MAFHRTPLTIAIALAVPILAQAHEFELFAIATDHGANGTVSYATGPAAGITVRMIDSTAKPLAEVVSDAEGHFTFAAAPSRPFTIVAETEDGHRAEQAFHPDGTAAPHHDVDDHDHHDGTAIDNLEEHIHGAVEEALQPLRVELAERDRRARVRDIVAGIGYILGIFGVVALVRRRAKS